jgi:hypothetical protein
MFMRILALIVFVIALLPEACAALTTLFSLRTRNKITEIASEHPGQTAIEYVGESGKDVHVYKVQFARLGENQLRVKYDEGRYLSLDCFVTEPPETMFKKRAEFMVTHEQWVDPKLWHYGLISQWDMKREILRSPDDLDGLQSYAVASHDPALGEAPYIAGGNIYYPSQREIDAVGLCPLRPEKYGRSGCYVGSVESE